MQCIQNYMKKKKEEEAKEKYPICRELLLFEIFKTTFLSVIHLFYFFFFVHFILSSSSISRSDWSCAKFTAAKRSAKRRKLHFESLPLMQLTFAKLYSHTSTKFHGGKKSALYSNEKWRERKKLHMSAISIAPSNVFSSNVISTCTQESSSIISKSYEKENKKRPYFICAFVKFFIWNKCKWKFLIVGVSLTVKMEKILSLSLHKYDVYRQGKFFQLSFNPLR